MISKKRLTETPLFQVVDVHAVIIHVNAVALQSRHVSVENRKDREPDISIVGEQKKSCKIDLKKIR